MLKGTSFSSMGCAICLQLALFIRVQNRARSQESPICKLILMKFFEERMVPEGKA